MPHDLAWIGCGWMLRPARCCTNTAVVRVRSKVREIVACDFHRAAAAKWADDGDGVTVTEIGEPSTLF